MDVAPPCERNRGAACVYVRMNTLRKALRRAATALNGPELARIDPSMQPLLCCDCALHNKRPGVVCRGIGNRASQLAEGFAQAFAPHTPVSMSTVASSVTGVKVSCITMTPASMDTTVDTLPNIAERATGSLARE